MEISSNAPERRRQVRTLVRRFCLGIGFLLALIPTSSAARERATSSPRRVHRAGMPPWSIPNGSPPPRPFGSTAVGATVHPAIHGTKSEAKVTSLFPRANGDARRSSEKDAAMARHPAGKATKTSVVTVQRGDSLWAIAAERVGRDNANDCWPALYRRNRGVIGADPNHIEPHQKLNVPGACK